jgi:hypothetical protein
MLFDDEKSSIHRRDESHTYTRTHHYDYYNGSVFGDVGMMTYPLTVLCYNAMCDSYWLQISDRVAWHAVVLQLHETKNIESRLLNNTIQRKQRLGMQAYFSCMRLETCRLEIA